jgi:hypothetical protein
MRQHEKADRSKRQATAVAMAHGRRKLEEEERGRRWRNPLNALSRRENKKRVKGGGCGAGWAACARGERGSGPGRGPSGGGEETGCGPRGKEKGRETGLEGRNGK